MSIANISRLSNRLVFSVTLTSPSSNELNLSYLIKALGGTPSASLGAISKLKQSSLSYYFTNGVKTTIDYGGTPGKYYIEGSYTSIIVPPGVASFDIVASLPISTNFPVDIDVTIDRFNKKITIEKENRLNDDIVSVQASTVYNYFDIVLANDYPTVSIIPFFSSIVSNYYTPTSKYAPITFEFSDGVFLSGTNLYVPPGVSSFRIEPNLNPAALISSYRSSTIIQDTVSITLGDKSADVVIGKLPGGKLASSLPDVNLPPGQATSTTDNVVYDYSEHFNRLVSAAEQISNSLSSIETHLNTIKQLGQNRGFTTRSKYEQFSLIPVYKQLLEQSEILLGTDDIDPVEFQKSIDQLQGYLNKIVKLPTEK